MKSLIEPPNATSTTCVAIHVTPLRNHPCVAESGSSSTSESRSYSGAVRLARGIAAAAEAPAAAAPAAESALAEGEEADLVGERIDVVDGVRT